MPVHIMILYILFFFTFELPAARSRHPELPGLLVSTLVAFDLI